METWLLLTAYRKSPASYPMAFGHIQGRFWKSCISQHHCLC